MSGKYTDLDDDHKRELLVNLRATTLLAAVLEEVFSNHDALVIEIWKKAYSNVAELDETKLEGLRSCKSAVY